MPQSVFLIAIFAVAIAVTGCAKQESTDSAQQPAAEQATADKAAAKAEPAEGKAAKEDDSNNVAKVGALSPDEVEKLLSEKNAHCFDANGEETRAKFGTVPGAKLLASYRDYDLGLLPEQKDAKLVFYCSNTQCSAAPKAAERAVLAGYKDVNVMPEGIMGWKDAGKTTTAVN